MTFGDHLDELRRRVILALAVPLPLCIIAFFVSDWLIEWLLLPVFTVLRQHNLPSDLQVLSPPEFLLTKFKLSVIAALILSGPWILWQAWEFIRPGLYHHERRFVHFLVPGSAILTAAGIALMYYVMLPLMLHVLIMFAKNIEVDPGGPAVDEPVQQILASADHVAIRTIQPPSPRSGEVWLLVPQMHLYVAVADTDGAVGSVLVPRVQSGGIEQIFRVSFVVNFTLMLMLGIVIAFQMPLVILLLGWLGLVTTSALRAKRKYALFFCGVIAAVITPQDAVSMIMMLIPLYALFELSILMLAVAPASAVAEGAVFRRFGWRYRQRSDKAASHANQPHESAQTKRIARRTGAADQSSPQPTDDQRDGQ